MSDQPIYEPYRTFVWRRLKFMGWAPWAFSVGVFIRHCTEYQQAGIAVTVIGMLVCIERAIRLGACERRQGLKLSPRARRISLITAIIIIGVMLGAIAYVTYKLEMVRREMGL